ncbi:MAG: threonine synthase, partial [Sphaerochaetaceae bacterium]|nr:threonine synthase [Sphaerochaetaceae bacterium]
MKYQSTRSNIYATSTEAVLSGMAPDGGLYGSKELGIIPFNWENTLDLTVLKMAEAILSYLLPDFTNMEELVTKAYENKFETEDLTPVVKVGDNYVLELFRGPTSAFKDVALSMLPQLMTAARKLEGSQKETVILTATSGDTGKAALEGFHDVEGTKIMVFYPNGGVSPIQRAQMATQVGKNVKVCAVDGNFDDCQTAVKEAFATINGKNLLEGKNKTLSSANSINIGRLAPQVVYYFKAYSDLVKNGVITKGQKVDYVVPTGNFGDILAGYYSKLMGLPVGKLVCASNANNVLTDFLNTGIYNKNRTFMKTTSPSMDILVSSNLERLLFIASDYNTEKVAQWMSDLKKNNVFTVEKA